MEIDVQSRADTAAPQIDEIAGLLVVRVQRVKRAVASRLSQVERGVARAVRLCGTVCRYAAKATLSDATDSYSTMDGTEKSCELANYLPHSSHETTGDKTTRPGGSTGR
eukprot:6178537-Pleurochrysis_carterae.AAC.2